ncbi:MAG: AAA family ATPase [Nitrospirae bacterium]|nr:AAA family ATPase [Nitrospirota bacterium]
MHKIHIKNFGPIKDLKMDVKDYLVLIGQQATGKSTISKLIYFFRTVKEEMYGHFSEEIKSPESLKKILTHSKKAFIDKMNNKLYMIFDTTTKDNKSYITYNYGNNITIKLLTHVNKSGQYILKFEMNAALTNSFKQFFQKSISIAQELRQIDDKLTTLLSDWEIIKNKLTKEECFNVLKNDINKLFNDDVMAVYFLPAGRSIASVFFSNRYKGSVETGDYILDRFTSRNILFRNIYSNMIKDLGFDDGDGFYLNAAYADKLIKEILKGDYRYIRETNEEFLIINEDEYIKMQFASSGQQESLWVLLTLRVLMYHEISKVLFIVEEPEAHLYPIAQRKLVEFISFVMNATNSQMIITTHSPYILTSLNNLIFANNVAIKTGKESEVSEIIDKRLWIDIDKIGVFELEGGECTDIVSKRLNFIKAEEIDKASRDINDDFERLFEIR